MYVIAISLKYMQLKGPYLSQEAMKLILIYRANTNCSFNDYNSRPQFSHINLIRIVLTETKSLV